MQEFRSSLVVTVVALFLAGWWGYSRAGVTGALQALSIAAILAVMEISLSFDNAVVNATVLRTWNAFWRKLFMTVGMLVAVFGMRLVFPLVIVAVATDLSMYAVAEMALQHPEEYSRHLTSKHAEVAAFGGAFLLLVFLNFLFDEEKEHHWLPWLEPALSRHGSEGLAIVLTLLAIYGATTMLPDQPAVRYPVMLAGVLGVMVHVSVNFLSSLLEEGQKDDLGRQIQTGSIGGFLYLEVLDASFSFDGVIGAFAITNDVIIIMLGLAIGAMFVRSMTMFLVERGTLQQFVYLEHGAHYAIGILAAIMLVSIKHHVPEWITGLSGVAFIGLSLWSSLKHRRKHAAT